MVVVVLAVKGEAIVVTLVVLVVAVVTVSNACSASKQQQ